MEKGLLFGVAVEAAVGLLCMVLGLIVWKKQKVSLLHDYHYRNVKKEDVPAYTRKMGIGLIIMGTGVLAAGVCNLFACEIAGYVSLGLGFAAGFLVMHKTQMRYNGSWFS